MDDYNYFRPNMSLYIPSVTITTTEKQVKYVFESLNIGKVSRVDFIEKDKDTSKFMAFVHFDYWFINDSSYNLQEKILSTGQSRVVYNDPYYWIVMENKNPRTLNEVLLEKEVIALKNRVKYLEIVMSTHTRKFMDNNIVTKTKNCDRCWADMKHEDTVCKVCDYVEQLQENEETVEETVEETQNVRELDLRTALRRGNVEVMLNNVQINDTVSSEESEDNSEHEHTDNSKWSWW
jgi:hypothetical protein